MATLKAILAAVQALATYLTKVWPDWNQRRQSKIDKLKEERNGLHENLRALQILRDAYLSDLQQPPDWLQERLTKTITALRQCNEQLRGFGAE